MAVLERDPTSAAAAARSAGASPSSPATPPPATDNERAVAATVEAFGGLDLFVSCVGIFDFYRGLGDIDAGRPRRRVRRGVRGERQEPPACGAGGPARAARAPGLGGAHASTSAYYPGRGGVLYVASKFAVRGLVDAPGPRAGPGGAGERRRPGRHRAAPTCGALRASGWTAERLDDAPGARRRDRRARAAAGGARRRGPRVELRLPRLRAGPGHHRRRRCTPTAGSGAKG